jgi:hypothetical protein
VTPSIRNPAPPTGVAAWFGGYARLRSAEAFRIIRQFIRATRCQRAPLCSCHAQQFVAVLPKLTLHPIVLDAEIGFGDSLTSRPIAGPIEHAAVQSPEEWSLGTFYRRLKA